MTEASALEDSLRSQAAHSFVRARSEHPKNDSGSCPGATFSASSSDASDSFSQTTLGGFPKVSVTTNDQSQTTGDRTLTFKYTVNSVTATQTMAVTARKFAFATNASPVNVCSLGNGFDDTVQYTPFTHPDGTAVPLASLSKMRTTQILAHLRPGMAIWM